MRRWTRRRKGFRDALTEKLGDKVVFDEQNAAGDTASCATIANGFVAAEVDLIMANATPALQAGCQRDGGYSDSRHVDYRLRRRRWKSATGTATTGINVSGTSDLAPLDGQAAHDSGAVPGCEDGRAALLLRRSEQPLSDCRVKAELEAMGSPAPSTLSPTPTTLRP